MKYLYYLLLFTVAVQGCTSPDESSTTDDATPSLTSPTPSTTQADEVAFKCSALAEADGMPMQQVQLVINGTSYIVDTFNTCQSILPEGYLQYDMPENTLAATYSWWAGYGEYLYAIEQQGKVTLVRGWTDEMEETPGFHYEPVATYDR